MNPNRLRSGLLTAALLATLGATTTLTVSAKDFDQRPTQQRSTPAQLRLQNANRLSVAEKRQASQVANTLEQMGFSVGQIAKAGNGTWNVQVTGFNAANATGAFRGTLVRANAKQIRANRIQHGVRTADAMRTNRVTGSASVEPSVVGGEGRLGGSGGWGGSSGDATGGGLTGGLDGGGGLGGGDSAPGNPGGDGSGFGGFPGSNTGGGTTGGGNDGFDGSFGGTTGGGDPGDEGLGGILGGGGTGGGDTGGNPWEGDGGGDGIGGNWGGGTGGGDGDGLDGSLGGGNPPGGGDGGGTGGDGGGVAPDGDGGGVSPGGDGGGSAGPDGGGEPPDEPEGDDDGGNPDDPDEGSSRYSRDSATRTAADRTAMLRVTVGANGVMVINAQSLNRAGLMNTKGAVANGKVVFR